MLANLRGAVPSTEPTTAAAHGLYDLDSGDWHRELIASLGLDCLRYPEIHPFTQPVGEIVVHGQTLTCFPPVGDQQCALLARV